MKVVLGSKSPRRCELLKKIYPEFTVIVPKCDEHACGTPEEYVMTISKIKSDAIKSDADVIITSDTIVVFDGKILGKPKDEQDAINTLTMLSGKEHYVYSGVCIKYSTNGTICAEVFYDKSTVFMKELSQKQIYDYVKTGSPLDKAGSYGIQDGVVKSFDGSYDNIVGLPVEKLREKLKTLNLI